MEGRQAEGQENVSQQRAGSTEEGWQYIRQQRAGSTSGSRGPAVHKAAEGQENIRQQRAGSTSGGRQYFRRQRTGSISGSRELAILLAAEGRQYIRQQRVGGTLGRIQFSCLSSSSSGRNQCSRHWPSSSGRLSVQYGILCMEKEPIGITQWKQTWNIMDENGADWYYIKETNMEYYGWKWSQLAL